MKIKVYDKIEKKEIGSFLIPLLAGYLMGCHKKGEDLSRYTYSVDWETVERFKMPTEDQLIKFSILFSEEDNLIDANRAGDMMAAMQFVVDRLYENGDVMIPSKKEDTK